MVKRSTSFNRVHQRLEFGARGDQVVAGRQFTGGDGGLGGGHRLRRAVVRPIGEEAQLLVRPGGRRRGRRAGLGSGQLVQQPVKLKLPEQRHQPVAVEVR